VNIGDAIRDIGAIAGLISIFLTVHQSRRNRPSFAFTQESSHSDGYVQEGRDFRDLHFRGLVRNASLNANTIVRLYLVVWKEGTVTQTLRFGHTVKAVTDLATNVPLTLPLRMEGRSAVRAEVVFPVRLTDSVDGQLMRETVPIPSTIPGLTEPKHTYEFVFEDAAGNYFHKSGRLLSRPLIDLNWTIQNHTGWRRVRHLVTIAWWRLRWKLADAQSWFGFYK
jgi:hypothetical protein